MLRHFHLFAAAPGREAEAEQALRRWLDDVRSATAFRGGAVLREYAGEFGEIVGALALTYDVESREAGAELRRATSQFRNPMAQDIPGDEPADQGEVLFGSPHGHAHGSDGRGHDHQPHHDGSGLSGLSYDRGGGLLARLMHGHFTVVSEAAPSPPIHTTAPEA
ncbi:MAG: hypothetical protein AB1736_03380 [Chloroflexota bacterium]